MIKHHCSWKIKFSILQKYTVDEIGNQITVSNHWVSDNDEKQKKINNGDGDKEPLRWEKDDVVYYHKVTPMELVIKTSGRTHQVSDHYVKTTYYSNKPCLQWYGAIFWGGN